jgi:hypothetical protein
MMALISYGISGESVLNVVDEMMSTIAATQTLRRQGLAGFPRLIHRATEDHGLHYTKHEKPNDTKLLRLT